MSPTLLYGATGAGVIAVVCLSRWVLGRVDLFASLNGGIGGVQCLLGFKLM